MGLKWADSGKETEGFFRRMGRGVLEDILPGGTFFGDSSVVLRAARVDAAREGLMDEDPFVLGKECEYLGSWAEEEGGKGTQILGASVLETGDGEARFCPRVRDGEGSVRTIDTLTGEEVDPAAGFITGWYTFSL